MIGVGSHANAASRSKSPMWSIVWFTICFALIAIVYTGLVFDFWAFGYFLLLVGSSYAALAGYVLASARPARTFRPPVTTARFNVVVGVLSLLGIFAILYDRTAIRGIDYIDTGIVAARAELNRAGERGGLISIAGNLFSVAIYLPLVNMVFDWERWGRERFLVFAIVIAGLFGLSYVTAGRTVVLIAVALAATAMLGRGAVALRRMPSFLTAARLALIFLGIAVFLGLIFALRANAFGAASAGDYLSRLCIHLAQPAIEIMAQCYSIPYASAWERVNEYLNYGTAVLLYAFHVAWVGDVIITDDNPGIITTFAVIQDMLLSRFGSYQISATDYTGYFIPAAAGLVYDFGYLAMIATFLILGFFFGVFQRNMKSGHELIGRIAFCYTGGALMISVLISPTNLPFFFLSIAVIFMIMVVERFRRAMANLPRRGFVKTPASA